MAQDDQNSDDRTEEATQERRDDFRERGQIAVSREVTAVFILLAATAVIYYGGFAGFKSMAQMMTESFQGAKSFRISPKNIIPYMGTMWATGLKLALPVCLTAASIATLATLIQTRFNWSWKRMAPNFGKMNPLSGIIRLASLDSAAELIKSTAKMLAIALVAFAVIRAELTKAPGLMMTPITGTWAHWASVTSRLAWSVGGIMAFIAAADFLYNWFRLEKQMKMTKQEVKEEVKRRESDPLLKGRQKRMAREIAGRKAIEKTGKATVLITNPTHYSIALKYEIGMGAPILLAKGVDHLALKMREAAKENDIPIVENRPLARALYAEVDEDQEIPESMYKAVSEIIRYVFKLKGRSTAKKAT